MPDKQIAILEVSPFRRWVGLGALLFLSFLTLYISLAQPPANLFGRITMPVMFVLFLVQALRNYRATMQGMVLTERGLIWDDGTLFYAISDIAKVDRATFGFKPSNGFALILKDRVPIRWQPGMYWQFGKRVGIGGSTQPGHAKAVADMLAELLKD